MKLELKNISMQFGTKTALNSITTIMNSGSLIGVIGPNGAGKSTLFKILTTLLKPTSGQILLDGQNILEKPKIIQSMMAYLPQHVPYIDNLTLTEYLNYIAGLKGINKKQANSQISYLVQRLHLSDVDVKTRLKDYSGGMLQRAALCATLLGNPQIIIVDEPTAGLDPEERINLRNFLSEMAKTKIVIMSTHIISDIEAVADHLLILNKGKLEYDGVPTELVNKANGHVWQIQLSNNVNIDQVKNKGQISSLVQTAEGVTARIISTQKPLPNAVQVLPHLEDAYLYLEAGDAK